MTTSPSGRVPTRLRIGEHLGEDELDAGWWPQSRHLATEVADLVEHLPRDFARIVRVGVYSADWDEHPRLLSTAPGSLSVFTHGESHMIHLVTSDGTTLYILVVPPGLSADHGETALLAAATSGNSQRVASLLDAVADRPDVDPADLWCDGEVSWWAPDPQPPSYQDQG